ALEQPYAETGLERGELPAHRRLRSTQPTRRCGESLRLDDGDERLGIPDACHTAIGSYAQGMSQMHQPGLSAERPAGIDDAMPETIQVSPVEGGVATIVLSRPEKKNALSIALRDEVSDAVDTLVRDDAVKVLVITGAGNVFSAGFDLGEFRALGDPEHAK